MAVLHRALFTWFNILTFLILIILKHDQKIQWNWFIVFIPMWLYDHILLVYVVFHMVSHCKNGRVGNLRRDAWHMTAVFLKLSAQILICLKLEVPQWFISAKVALAPFCILLPALAVDVFVHLIQHYQY